MIILGSTKLKDALKEYPQLKDFLISLSPKYEKLKNKFMFNIIKKWVTFNDVARMGDFSICELLHKVNKFIGKEKELYKHAPECIKEEKIEVDTERPPWIEEAEQIIVMDVRDRDDFFLQSIIKQLRELKPNQILKVVNNFYPAPLISMLKEEGYELFYENPSFNEHVVYVKYKEVELDKEWIKRKDEFEVMDVRGWKTDPFSEIIKRAQNIPPGEGFKIIQYFKPVPLINMIESMGFEVYVEKISPVEHHVYFYKKPVKVDKRVQIVKGRVPVVIQSATPVVYPMVMRLLQSRELMDLIKIEELKVWDKTEKHLGWIVNGKADISFSAVAAVTKLYQQGIDIKMKAIVVWDNFFILTRGFKGEDFSDLMGYKIYLPLIKSAPPYTITSFLMRKLGYDPDKFNFVFGSPFGRPGEIKDKLVKGEIEVGLLREPEASFAIYEGKGEIHESLSYKEIWEKLFPGKGNLPNAGVLFKGEFLRRYPEVADIFLKELKKAINQVVENPQESARLSYEIMGITPEEAELFLKRVHFEFLTTEEALEHIKHYVEVLKESGYTDKDFEDVKELFI